MSSLLSKFHKSFIYDRRIQRLKDFILWNIREYSISEILDVGAGDGKIDQLIMEDSHVNITGIDVLVRDHTYIPVTPYDGDHIPAEDNSVETVMMIDVLHHTDNPTETFNEAVRVSSKYILIKDHLLHGWWSYIKLRLMDYTGNKQHGVRLPYNYLHEDEWDTLIINNQLKIVSYETNLNLYKGIFHLLFDSNLHFMLLLEKEV